MKNSSPAALLGGQVRSGPDQDLLNHHKYCGVNTGAEQPPVWMCQHVVMETAAFLQKTWLLTFNSPAALLKSLSN